MSFTGVLGTDKSKPGNFKLGVGTPTAVVPDLILGSLAQFLIGQFPDSVNFANTSGFSTSINGSFVSSVTLNPTAGFTRSFNYLQNLPAVVLTAKAQLSVYQGITDFITFPSTSGMLFQSVISNALSINLPSIGGFSVSSSPVTFEGTIVLPGTSQFIYLAGFISTATLALANNSSGFSSVNEVSISLPTITSTAGVSVDFIYSPGALATFAVHPGITVNLIGTGGTSEAQGSIAGLLFDATIITGRLTSTTLAFNETLTWSRTIFPRNTLTFTQTVIGGKLITRRVNNTYLPTQLLNKTAIFNRSPSNQLNFNTYFSKQTTFGTFSIPQVNGTVVPKIATVRLSVPGRLVVLRAPIFGDTQNYTNSVSVKRCIQGDYFTYTKKPNTQKLVYSFEMGRIKSLELRDFLLNFSDKTVKLENWRGETWMGHVTNNPFVFATKGRYFNDREQVDLTLEFEGVQIA